MLKGKQLNEFVSKEAMELRKQYRMKAADHIEACDYDSYVYKISYPMYESSNVDIINAFAVVDDYASSTDNPTLLTKEEFSAVINYCACNSNDASYTNISKFIQDMRKLDISDDRNLLSVFSKYYDSVAMNDNNKLDLITDLVKKYKIESDEKFRNGIFNSEKYSSYHVLVNYLKKFKADALMYKYSKISLVKDYLKEEDFDGKDSYESRLIHELKKYNYDSDYILSNLPDINLVKKDYESLHGKSIVPYSEKLLSYYLNGDKKLNAFPDNLGKYKIHKVGNIDVPFTKSEFLKSIKNSKVKKLTK